MSTLDTQSTTVKTYAYLGDKVFIFSAGGVDIYQTSYISWSRLGYAALSNVTSGAVNANGIWLGTSDRGVWQCPIGNGDLTSQLQQYYAVSGTSYAIQSDDINSLAGIDTKLLVCHSLGAEYFASPGLPHQYSDEETDNAAINGTYIAYSVASGLETLAFPSNNWTAEETFRLNVPTISNDTVNNLSYGADNTLFIATGAGVDVFDYNESIGASLATGTDSDMSGANNWTGASLGTFDINTTVSDKLYMKGDGATDAANLDVLAINEAYYVSLKIKNTTTGGGSGDIVPFRIGGDLGGLEGDDYFEVIPQSSEGTYTGFFTRSSGNTTFNIGSVDGNIDGEAFEVDDVLIYNVTLDTISSGNIPYVWASTTATRTAGYVAYVDSSDDVVIYDLAGVATLDTAIGTFVACWIDDQADLTVRDITLEKFASIDHVSPASRNRDVRRDWTLYYEIGDTLHGLSSSDITTKINGGVVSTTITSFGSGFSNGFSSGFGGEGFKVTFTPVSSSGYRKEVKVEIIAVDGAGDPFEETFYFTTTTATNTEPAGTKAPSIVVYKDLSLALDESEEIYDGVNVNWLDESVLIYYVDEDQAKASAQVEVEKGIYHKHFLTVRVDDVDASSNATQDIKEGDIITIDVDGLGLVAQKCEVLSTQRVTNFDRIEYNLNLAYYVIWS